MSGMNNVLVTGSSGGIGVAVANIFIENGFNVYGFDIEPPKLELIENPTNYIHYIVDVSDKSTFPNKQELPQFMYIINSAGTQTYLDTNDNMTDIEVNLKGTINVCETYAFQPMIRSVVNVASCSGHTGAEFSRYAASKGGVLTYTKSLAVDLANLYRATVNSISPGGVLDSMNSNIIDNSEKWNEVMKVTPLKKWCDTDEMAEWIYFMSVKNKSMTGQDIIVDNGEMINSNFVW